MKNQLTQIPKADKKIYKAISLHQPWASYIADGRKKIETRNWYTHYRGDLLICSTKSPVLKGFPAQMALCIVDIYDCKLMKYADAERACCPWRPKAFSWFLRNLRRISPPFRVIGRQGLFDVEISSKLIQEIVTGREILLTRESKGLP